MPDAPAPSSPLPALRREIAGFAGVGALGAVVDIGLTMAFVELGWLTPALARLPATAIAICATFVFNRLWTFRSRDRNIAAEFARYVGVNATGGAISYVVYAFGLMVIGASGLIDPAGKPAILLAIMGGAAAAAVFNFVGSRWFAFVRRASAA